MDPNPPKHRAPFAPRPLDRVHTTRTEHGVASLRFETASTQELVERARAGDRWARDTLLRRYASSLTRMVRRLCARTRDADDVVQDTLADVIEQLPRLRDPASFEAWVHRIALNRVRKRFRRQKLQRLFGLDQGTPDATLAELARATESPEDIAELRKIDAVLGTLSTDERAAWILRYVEGHTVEHISSVLDCSVATTKRRVHVANSAIAEHVARGPA